MNLENFLKFNNAQNQIDKLAKKYKNKRIVIYGAGEYFDLIRQNYDLSALNIVGISDLKFESDKTVNKTNYTALAPQELKNFYFDVLIIALKNDYEIMRQLDKQIFADSKNRNIKITTIIYPTFSYLFKLYLGKPFNYTST